MIIAILALTVIMLGWFLVEAIKARRGFKTTADYFLWGDEDLSTGKFAGTFTAANTTFTSSFLAVAATAFLAGERVIWLLVTFVGGLFLFALLYRPTIGAWVGRGQVGSMHEFLGSYYGPAARKIGALNTVAASVGTVALEFLGIQVILESLSGDGFSPWVVSIGFLMIVVLTTAYTVIGGFREVVQSDIRQAIITFAALAILIAGIVLALSRDRGLAVSFAGALAPQGAPLKSATDLIFLGSMAVLFLPFQFCVMDMWQRCRSTKASPENVVRATIASTPLVTLPLAIAAGAGLFVRELVARGSLPAPSQPNLALFAGLQELLGPLGASGAGLDSVVLVVLGVGLIMAAVSTADTLLSSITYTVMIDLWSERMDKGSDAKGRSLTLLQLPLNRTFGIAVGLCVIAATLASLLTVFRWSLYDMALAIFGAQVSFTVPLGLAFFAPHVAAKVKGIAPWALLVGLVTPSIAVVTGKLAGIPNLVAGAPLLAFLLVSLFFFCYWPLATLFGDTSTPRSV